MGKGFARQKKQARALQEKFAKMQEELANVEVTGSAGGGLVEIKLNSDHQITGLKIKPECVDKDDLEGLEDLIRAAHKDAHDKMSKMMPDPTQMLGGMGGGAAAAQLGSMFGGMGL